MERVTRMKSKEIHAKFQLEHQKGVDLVLDGRLKVKVSLRLTLYYAVRAYPVRN